jgi:formylmethanofuran dehydrogenase subunit E
VKCEACEKTFPEAEVKVWNGKRVCSQCFHTLTGRAVAESPRGKPLS